MTTTAPRLVLVGKIGPAFGDSAVVSAGGVTIENQTAMYFPEERAFAVEDAITVLERTPGVMKAFAA